MSKTRLAFAPVDEQLAAYGRGVVECYSINELRTRLERSRETGRPLRVKLGLDPSRPDIHVGHTVVLRKLRQFQDFGHQAVLIIGDYTAMVGDPTGRSKTRPQLTEKEVATNAQTYLDQVGGILDVSRLEIRRNGEWFSTMAFSDVLKLAGRITVARMLERDDFSKRYASGAPISLHEFLYPLMQGHDSVMIESDVELGGTDQTFNLLMGRKLQEDAGLEPQICVTTPLIEGLDGVQKMSKSLGNAIGVTEAPDDMFGKTMSISDGMMRNWFTLLTDVSIDDITILCDPEKTNPRHAKDQLAREVVARFHSREAADAASAEFVRRTKQGGIPDDIPSFVAPAAAMSAIDLVVGAGLAASRSEARRLIEQGGVSLIPGGASTDAGTGVTDVATMVSITPGSVLKVGKRRFVRLILPS